MTEKSNERELVELETRYWQAIKAKDFETARCGDRSLDRLSRA